jgi:hypothetical protein
MKTDSFDTCWIGFAMEHMINTLGGGAATSGTAAPGSSLLMTPAALSLNWGNYMFERDYAQKMHYIRMPQTQWEEGVAGHLAAHPHNYAVRQWVARVEAQRAEYQDLASQRIVVETPDSDELDFRLWQDMIENPCMYGDDIVEWLELNEAVLRGPKRWRVGAYWARKQDEENAKAWQRVLGLLARAGAQQQQWREEAENAMATRIQAAWRGYSTRVRQTWRDCAKCLAHGICVEQVEGEHVCRCCWGEANPVEDDVATPMDVEEEV